MWAQTVAYWTALRELVISIRTEGLRAAIGVRGGPSKARKSLRALMNARRRWQLGVIMRPDSYSSENPLPAINYKIFTCVEDVCLT